MPFAFLLAMMKERAHVINKRNKEMSASSDTSEGLNDGGRWVTVTDPITGETRRDKEVRAPDFAAWLASDM